MCFRTTLSFMLCWWHSVHSHHYLPTLLFHFIFSVQCLMLLPPQMLAFLFICSDCQMQGLVHLNFIILIHFFFHCWVFVRNIDTKLCGLDKRSDKVRSGWLSLFIYISHHGLICLLMFPFLCCGMLIICAMLRWFQDCLGQPWTLPSEKKSHGGKKLQLDPGCKVNALTPSVPFPFIPTKILNVDEVKKRANSLIDQSY